jgi:hypothetical protein
MRRLFLFIALLFPLSGISPSDAMCGPAGALSTEGSTEGTLAVADNKLSDPPGWDRLKVIIRTHGMGTRKEQWIYDGTRDESFYFENGHFG